LREAARMDLSRTFANYAKGIDHVALAVPDLDKAAEWYGNVLGFTVEEEKHTQGKMSAMRSRVARAGTVTIVLCQGTHPADPVCKFIDAFGPGVQHVAILVENIDQLVDDLKQQGVGFDTPVIVSPNLKQAFTHRDAATNMVFELVERNNYGGFQDQNVQQLWDSLEKSDSF
jgi:methylmalonyl-CoA/ethylmalonyl-CoA epimerase